MPLHPSSSGVPCKWIWGCLQWMTQNLTYLLNLQVRSVIYKTCNCNSFFFSIFPLFPFSSLFSYFLFPLSSLRPMAVAVLCTPGLCGDADEGCGAEHVDVHVCEKLVPTPQPPSHLTDPEASLPPLGRLETWYELLIHLEKCHIYHC